MGRGMRYDGEGSGMLCTWSVLRPSLLHYSHAYPIAAAPYLPVVLLDTNMLEQHHRELSEPANAHASFPIKYPSLPSTRRAPSGGRILFATHVRFNISGRKDRSSYGGTCLNLLPMPSRTYGQPHIFLTNDPTTSSACEDVRDDV